MKNKDIFKKLGKKVDESRKFTDDSMTNSKKYLILDPAKCGVDIHTLIDDLSSIYGNDVDVHKGKIALHDVSMWGLKSHFPAYASCAIVWNPKQVTQTKSFVGSHDQRPVDESYKFKDKTMTKKQYVKVYPKMESFNIVFGQLHGYYGNKVDVHNNVKNSPDTKYIAIHNIRLGQFKHDFPEYAGIASENIPYIPFKTSIEENKKSKKTIVKEAEQKEVNFHEIDDMFRKIAKDIVTTSKMLASKGVGEKNEFMKKLKTMYGIFTDMGSAEKAFGGYQTVSEDIVTDKAKAIQNPNDFKKTVDLAKKVDTNIQLNENINDINMRVKYHLTLQPVDGESKPLGGGETQLSNVINKYGKKDFAIGQVNANQISLFTTNERGNDYTLVITGNFGEDEAQEIANAFVQEEMIEEDSIYDYAPEQPEVDEYEFDDKPQGKFNCKIFIPELTNFKLIKQFENQIKNTERQGYTSFTVQGVNTNQENDGLFVELVGMCDLDTDDLRKAFEHDLADVVEGIVNRIPEMIDVDFY